MIIYGIIVLTVGITILILSILFFLGHINLLHEYHRTNVKEEDKLIFGRKIGISLLIMSIGMLSSGAIALINSVLDTLALILLFVPLFISIILIVVTIIKYNGKFID